MAEDYKKNITRIEDFLKRKKELESASNIVDDVQPKVDDYRTMYGKAQDTVQEASKAAVGKDPERIAKLSKILNSPKAEKLPADVLMKIQNEIRMMERNAPSPKDVAPFLSKVKNSAKLIPILGPLIGIGTALGTGDAGAAVPVPGFESEALGEGEEEALIRQQIEDEKNKKKVWNILKDTPKRDY